MKETKAENFVLTSNCIHYILQIMLSLMSLTNYKIIMIKKHFTCLILLDLSKAFDTANHQIVLNKLQKYGIGGNFLQLLNDYLSNRKQVVYINNTNSRQQDVSCGMPQGSTLGPLLFTIYINDQPKISKFETRLFANDKALILSDKNMKSLNVKVNSELIKVEQWLSANTLSLNYSETKYLLIKPFAKNSYTDEFSVSIRGIQLRNCHSAKYLGVIIDENRNWKPHVQYLQKKLSTAAGSQNALLSKRKKRCCVVLHFLSYIYAVRNTWSGKCN